MWFVPSEEKKKVCNPTFLLDVVKEEVIWDYFYITLHKSTTKYRNAPSSCTRSPLNTSLRWPCWLSALHLVSRSGLIWDHGTMEMKWFTWVGLMLLLHIHRGKEMQLRLFLCTTITHWHLVRGSVSDRKSSKNLEKTLTHNSDMMLFHLIKVSTKEDHAIHSEAVEKRGWVGWESKMLETFLPRSRINCSAFKPTVLGWGQSDLGVVRPSVKSHFNQHALQYKWTIRQNNNCLWWISLKLYIQYVQIFYTIFLCYWTIYTHGHIIIVIYHTNIV